MRTNVILPDDLHSALKERCEFSGVNMSELIRSYAEIEIRTPIFTANPRPEKPHIDSAERMAEAARRKRDILARVANGESNGSIAADYGMTVSGVSKIKARARQNVI